MPELLKNFSFRLLPGCCLLCGQATRRARDLCIACENELPNLENACERCAIPVPSRELTCGACLRQPPPQHVARAAFRYAYPLDSLVQRFKFHGDHAAGRVLGELFAERLPSDGELPECMLPVPLHHGRLRERGFNQSELLADALGEALGIDIHRQAVKRQRETAVQSGMNAVERRRNVRGAFALRTAALSRHVAIVDDVVTTGSTTQEIAKLLRRAGVRRIEVWTLARAV